MAEDILIRASGLSKVYPPRSDALRVMAALLRGRRAQHGLQALHDVSFELARGEALGIVGRNGAGKSTLLQIVAGTQAPTSGTVERYARSAAMLALGAGFNPDFTGRENVHLSAALHGLDDAQIEQRFDDIAAFADIGEFMDRPVREYSSGMYARLAFSICAHVDAALLIVDEILGVGDAAFQARCRAWIERFLQSGALIFVSHDEGSVVSLCNRAIWLDRGRCGAEGPPADVLRMYRQATTSAEDPVECSAMDPSLEPVTTAADGTWLADPRRGRNPILVSPFLEGARSHGHGGARINDVYFADQDGRRLDLIQGGESVALHIRGVATSDVARPIIGFILRDWAGQNILGDNTSIRYRDKPKAMRPGDAFHSILSFRLPYLPVGAYTIAPSVIDGTQRSHIQLYWLEEALTLTVEQSPVRLGKVGVPMMIDAPRAARERTADGPG